MLHSLTDAQRAKLSGWTQRWIDIGLSTEPADKRTFERAVRTLYLEQRRNAPSRVIWTGSPLAVDLVMMHLTATADTPEFDLSFLPRCVAEQVREIVRVETGSQFIRGTRMQLQRHDNQSTLFSRAISRRRLVDPEREVCRALWEPGDRIFSAGRLWNRATHKGGQACPRPARNRQECRVLVRRG